jgi:catechol 2,3-dioxygenase
MEPTKFLRDEHRPSVFGSIDPGVTIGHVHLKVGDLERALDFYCGVLGFELTQRLGSDAAFVSAGGYHHHLGLNTWESRGGPPPPPGTTGLYHVAIRYPTRSALADALRRLETSRIPLEGAADHGVSEALYLRDPDGNGLELYWDRPAESWPRMPDGRLAMGTERLDLAELRSVTPESWAVGRNSAVVVDNPVKAGEPFCRG